MTFSSSGSGRCILGAKTRGSNPARVAIRFKFQLPRPIRFALYILPYGARQDGIYYRIGLASLLIFYRAAGIRRTAYSTKLNTGTHETALRAACSQGSLKFIRSILGRSANRLVYAPYACHGRYLAVEYRVKRRGKNFTQI